MSGLSMTSPTTRRRAGSQAARVTTEEETTDGDETRGLGNNGASCGREFLAGVARLPLWERRELARPPMHALELGEPAGGERARDSTAVHVSPRFEG